jgi:hypothetical protein
VIPKRAWHLNRSALSTKLLKYIAVGLPVLVSRLETLFEPDEVPFFAPDNPDSLPQSTS